MSGCALVLGDIPSLREIWDDAAVFVRPDDTRTLGAALGSLDAEATRGAPRLARLRTEAAQIYSTKRMARAYHVIYRQLVPVARCHWRDALAAAPIGGMHARRDVLSLAGVRLEPRQRALPPRRRERTAGARARRASLRAARRVEPAEPDERAGRRRPIEEFRLAYPQLREHRVRPGEPRSGRRRSTAPTWSSSTSGTRTTWSRRIGQHRATAAGYHLLFHDTHHRAVTEPAGDGRATTCRTTTACSRSAKSCEDSTSRSGWAAPRVDLARSGRHRACSIRPKRSRDEGDLVWIGNWGDDERTAELHEFLLEPVRSWG